MKLINQKGVGFVELIIGVGLALFAVLTVSTMTTNYYSMGKKIQRSSSGQERADGILNLFKTHDNKLNASNWHPLSNAPLAAPPAYSTGLVPLAGGAAAQGRLTLFGANNNNNNGASTNAWALIDSGVNWAASLYNQGGYCGNAVAVPGGIAITGTLINPAAFTGPLTIPPYPVNATEKIYLDIERVNIQTGKRDCLTQGTFTPTPIGASTVVGGNTISTTPDFGLQVKVSVAYTDPTSNKVIVANASTVLRPAADTIPPSFLPVPFTAIDPLLGQCPQPVANIYSNCVCGGVGTTNGVLGNYVCMTSPCTAGGGCVAGYLDMQVSPTVVCTTTGTANINLAFLGSEAATLFNCELDYNAGANPVPALNNLQSCAQFTEPVTGTVAGASTSTYQTATTTTGLNVAMKNAPAGYYALTVQGSDSATNPSSQVSKYFQVMQDCPAWWTNGFCPGPAPSYCGTGNVCNGTMPLTCAPPSMYACGVGYVDICGRGCGNGTGYNAAQCTANAAGVLCGQGGVTDDCGNPCPNLGTAYDVTSCAPFLVVCGQPGVTDACGNACPMNGTGPGGPCPDPSGTGCGNAVNDACGNQCDVGTAPNCDPFSAPIGQQANDCCGNTCNGTCNPNASPTPDTCDNITCVGGPPLPSPGCIPIANPPTCPPPANVCKGYVCPGLNPPTCQTAGNCVYVTCPTNLNAQASCNPLNGQYSCADDGVSTNDPSACNTTFPNSGSCEVYTCSPVSNSLARPVPNQGAGCTVGSVASVAGEYCLCNADSSGNTQYYCNASGACNSGGCPNVNCPSGNGLAGGNNSTCYNAPRAPAQPPPR